MCKTPVRLVPVVHVSAGDSRASQTRACIGPRRIPPKRGEPPMPPAPVVVPRIGRSHGKPLSSQCPPPVQWRCGRRRSRRLRDQRIRSPRTELGRRPGQAAPTLQPSARPRPHHRYERPRPRVGPADQGRWPRADRPPHLRRPRRRRHRARSSWSRQAHAAGQLPVISYKVGRDIAGAASGKFNAVAAQAAAKLASYDKPTAVTFWHEPHGDISPAQYIAASKQILPNFKRGKLRVGPILNGFLLDRQSVHVRVVRPQRPLRALGLVRDRHLRVRHHEATPAPSSRRTGFRSWPAS